MEEFNPLVSIVIPVYNGSNYMRQAIDSALNQTYKNIEILVINDGSKDDTEQIALSYGNKIRYFNKENGGVASALNLGIKEMKGEYFSWLSHDDIYYPNKIERQIQELRGLEDRESIIFSNFDILNEFKKSKYNFPILENFINQKFSYYFNMLDVFFASKIHGCSLLIAKKHFNTVGYFDESKRTVQDYLLWMSFHKAKIKFHYIPEILITSRHHQEQDTQKILPLHFKELNFLYRWAFDTFKDEFQKMPLWQLDHFLEILKDRGLDKVYAYIISEWANGDWNKNKPTIWMYWENKPETTTYDCIRLCWKTIIINNKYDFQIKILTEDDVIKYLPDINNNYKLLKEIAHKADYIRFALLYKYGGIWLDSDMICFRSLNEVKDKIEEYGFVCNGYRQESGNIFPLIAFLASKPKNIICKKFLKMADALLLKIASDELYQTKLEGLEGYNLAGFVNDESYKYFIYDSSYFSPYPCHNPSINDEKIVTLALKYLKESNFFAFTQSLSVSARTMNFKQLTEQELLSQKTLMSDMLRLGLSNTSISNVSISNVSKKKKFAKYKLWRIFYRYFLRIILKFIYGRKKVKQKYDVRFL
jgi:glycosyltransferase involved in cell wall biosynthesis